MAKARTGKVVEILDRLEKIWGRTPRLKGASPSDLLGVLLLWKGSDGAQAEKAVKALRAEFVDWNEIRISYVREVSAALAAAGCDDPTDRARVLRAVLERLYTDRNGVDLAFIDELEPEQVWEFLRAYPEVGDGPAAALASLVLEEGQCLGVTEVLRVPGRIGLAGRKASPARVRKLLEELPGEDLFRAHLLFATHGVEPCRSRAPLCQECGLVDLCEYGTQALRQAGLEPRPPKPPRAERTAAPRRKVAPQRKSAGGKSAATKKKAAAGKTAAKKAAPKKTAPKKTAPKKAAAKKAAAKKKTAPKKAAGKKAAAPRKRAGSGKPPQKKGAPRKRAAPKKRSAATRKASSRKTAPRKKSR